MTGPDEYVVDWPALWVAPAWIEHHCRVPDGFYKGEHFMLADWQLWCALNHYRVRPKALPAGTMRPDGTQVSVASAFHYRRSQIVGPQKALALDTPVVTPTGWSTMADLAVGDEVFDRFGAQTRVVAKSDVFEEATYRVTFSDHSVLVAGADHVWVVERRTASATYVEERWTTEEMAQGGLVDRHGARRFRVRTARPLKLDDIELPIPPYTLGAWLGDGNADDSRITGIDRGIFDRIGQDGYEIRQMAVAKRVRVAGLRPQLRVAGLLGNKHIPAAYLRASDRQRWELLQGLMDTDGYVDARKGACEFTTVLPALRDGAMELIRSLGLKPVCREGRATLRGRETGPKWRIAFAARADLPVFHLERKRRRLPSPGGGHAQFKHRRIISIEPGDTVPTQCITVESATHTFLAGREMIPTGNCGKGPFAATMVAAEGVGPVVFIGWAGAGDQYVCAEHGCSCGWVYDYEPGEPMGMAWPTPLIQLTATSEDQVGNVFKPLKAMIELGPLAERMIIWKDSVQLPQDGEIAVVTSSANSRLGNPVTFPLQDETGLYTKANKLDVVADTQRRGAAGMGGRSMETTNTWDPAQQSTAQQTYESSAPDVFKFYRSPPANLSYRNKRERRKIHEYVYAGSWWVDLDSIEGEAAELEEKEPGQPERFFGNKIVRGQGVWLADGLWESAKRARSEPAA